MGKIFLGGISPETTRESIEAYFGQFGTVIDAVAMVKDGKPRCFGFVTFEDSTVADAVLGEIHELDGQQIEVKSAVPREEQPARNPYVGGAAAPLKPLQPLGGGGRNNITDKVFVGGLSSTLTDEEFHAYFSQYGNIVDAVVMKDRATGNPKGFGFVQYDNTDSVDLVMTDYQAHTIDGKWVEVKRAIPKERMAAVAAPTTFGKSFGKGCGKPFNGGGFGYAPVVVPRPSYAPRPAYNPAAPPGQRFGGGGYGGGKAYGGGKGFRAFPY